MRIRGVQTAHLCSLIRIFCGHLRKRFRTLGWPQSARPSLIGRHICQSWSGSFQEAHSMKFLLRHWACICMYRFLTFRTLCKIFSRRYIEFIFLFSYFFQENRFWLFTQFDSNGDNLHEMSNPVFWKNNNNKKNIITLSSAELAESVVKVNSF